MLSLLFAGVQREEIQWKKIYEHLIENDKKLYRLQESLIVTDK